MDSFVMVCSDLIGRYSCFIRRWIAFVDFPCGELLCSSVKLPFSFLSICIAFTRLRKAEVPGLLCLTWDSYIPMEELVFMVWCAWTYFCFSVLMLLRIASNYFISFVHILVLMLKDKSTRIYLIQSWWKRNHMRLVRRIVTTSWLLIWCQGRIVLSGVACRYSLYTGPTPRVSYFCSIEANKTSNMSSVRIE
jgi:hypothetical protein